MLMVYEGLRAGVAAERVGYESSSQFSRDFKRLFGRVGGGGEVYGGCSEWKCRGNCSKSGTPSRLARLGGMPLVPIGMGLEVAAHSVFGERDANELQGDGHIVGEAAEGQGQAGREIAHLNNGAKNAEKSGAALRRLRDREVDRLWVQYGTGGAIRISTVPKSFETSS